VAIRAVQVADHTRDDSMDAIAAGILAHAPPRFALVGLSMGGYIALTIVRQAPARVHKLALLDTSARPETPEQSERRKPQIALAQGGHFAEVPPLQFPVFVHRNRQHDEALRARVRSMAEETGAEAFLRQQKAIMTRPDMRPLLASIACPTRPTSTRCSSSKAGRTIGSRASWASCIDCRPIRCLRAFEWSRGRRPRQAAQGRTIGRSIKWRLSPRDGIVWNPVVRQPPDG